RSGGSGPRGGGAPRGRNPRPPAPRGGWAPRGGGGGPPARGAGAGGGRGGGPPGAARLRGGGRGGGATAHPPPRASLCPRRADRPTPAGGLISSPEECDRILVGLWLGALGVLGVVLMGRRWGGHTARAGSGGGA